MSRRFILSPILAVVVVAVAVITAAVGGRPDAGPPIQTKALGVWQEQTTSQPIRLDGERRGSAPANVSPGTGWTYAPHLRRASLPARLEGARILVWGEGTPGGALGHHLRRGRGRTAPREPERVRAAHPASRLYVASSASISSTITLLPGSNSTMNTPVSIIDPPTSRRHVTESMPAMMPATAANTLSNPSRMAAWVEVV